MRKVKPVNAEGIAVTYTRQDADGGQRVMKDLGPGNSIWSMDPTSTLTKPRTCYHCWRINVVGIKLLQRTWSVTTSTCSRCCDLQSPWACLVLLRSMVFTFYGRPAPWQMDKQTDRQADRWTDRGLDRTYMGTSQVRYSSSRHADRECRLQAAEGSTCPEQRSKEWATELRMEDCAGHSMEDCASHSMEDCAGHSRAIHYSSRDRILRSSRRQRVHRIRHRHLVLQWRHSAYAYCSRPSSC